MIYGFEAVGSEREARPTALIQSQATLQGRMLRMTIVKKLGPIAQLVRALDS